MHLCQGSDLPTDVSQRLRRRAWLANTRMNEHVDPPTAVANHAGSPVRHQVHISAPDLVACLTLHGEDRSAMGASLLAMIPNLLLSHDPLLMSYRLRSKKPVFSRKETSSARGPKCALSVTTLNMLFSISALILKRISQLAVPPPSVRSLLRRQHVSIRSQHEIPRKAFVSALSEHPDHRLGVKYW